VKEKKLGEEVEGKLAPGKVRGGMPASTGGQEQREREGRKNSESNL
jgi:hypothetical protein